ncbi:hypothetical protein [Rhodococcus qingshengii]|uniref:hypothetical protein n=1 Tax=Rhodococcus qingshengii TaxID=334542 RepID=UPI001C5F73DB|nr:hypothetical protein [Rhodococcus qingshengii]MBW4813330.1 hypothetical protein [Rhodococcus qingshengii]
MTGVDVEHTKALEAAATPGPWYWDEDNWLDVAAAHYVIEPDDDGFEDTTQLKVRPEDKEFIAHARTAVPALVAAVERVQALHTPSISPSLSPTDQYCDACTYPWPCETLQALEIK